MISFPGRSLRGVLLISLVAITGCGKAPVKDAQVGRVRSPADPLAVSDLDRLLAVVQTHGGGAIPEFTPNEQERSVDYNSRAGDIVELIRSQLGELFDARRQGDAWTADESWARSFAQHDVTGAQFASIVHSVSCAIMRVRLSARVDVDRLVTNARAEVRELVSTMNAIDEIPAAERSRQDAVIRGQSALSLARTVALLEFAEMIHKVPKENCALVKKYSKQLKPLLPPGGTDNILAELQALATRPASDVLPAGHSASEPE